MWRQVQVSTDGGAAPCCMAMQEDDPEWRKQTYEDGVMGAKWIEGREQMLRGEWPKICTVCKDNEERNIRSSRQKALIKPIEFDLKPKFRMLDIKFTTKCQLACRMCHPSDSSMVGEQFIDKPKSEIPHYFRDRMYIPEDTAKEKVEFTKNAIENGLTYLKVTGGEPTASIHFLRLIDWIIENDYHYMIELEITTNAVKISDKLIEKFSMFREMTYDISCDGFYDSYEYVRWPAKWETFESNIRKIKQSGANVNMATIATIYNLFDLSNIQSFSEDLGIHWRVNCDLRPHGSELSIDYLPSDIVEEAKSLYWFEEKKPIKESWYSIHRKIKDGTPFDHIHVDFEKKEIYNRLMNAEYNELKHQQFVESTLIMDRQRNQSYKVLDPRIVKYIDAKV